MPPKRSKRRKGKREDEEPQLFYVQRTPPEKVEPEAPAARAEPPKPEAPPEPAKEPEPAPAPVEPAAPPPAEPPLPAAEKIAMTKLAKPPEPEPEAPPAPAPDPTAKAPEHAAAKPAAPEKSEPIQPVPETPEEAIPALTAREPSNPEMSNPAPLGSVAEPSPRPQSKLTPTRLGILQHEGPPKPAKAAAPKRSSKRSAIVVGVSVLGSRLMGVVREQIFAFMFGTGLYAEAFVAAFRIPNLLRDLFAEGALSTAFTTTFTKKWETEGDVSAWHLARLVFSTLTLVLGVICILGTVFASNVVHFISGGFTAVPGKFEITVQLTQLMFPFILFVSIAAAVMGILNSRHVFGIPASASTVFNIVSVVAGFGLAVLFEPQEHWLHPHFGQRAVIGWCFGVLLGGIAQLAMQLPSLWNVGFNFRAPLKLRDFWTDSGLRTVMILMVPSAIAGSAVQVNVMVNQQFASLDAGAVASLYYAFRLVQLPIGIFGVAIATVTLPAVARLHALDDLKAFGKTVEDALRFGFYLTLPASVGLCAIAAPVIQLIYEHGRFDAESTRRTALALEASTIGLAGYSGIKILVPCFYAMQPPRFESLPGATFWQSFRHFVWNVILFTAARVSLTGIAINLALCYALYDFCHLGFVGLAMATGFVAVLNFLQLVYAISKQISLGHISDWLSYFVRVSAATLACGGVVLGLDTLLLANRTTHSLLGALILFINIGIAGAVYLGLTIAMKVPESLELVNVIKRKLGRSSSAR